MKVRLSKSTNDLPMTFFEGDTVNTKKYILFIIVFFSLSTAILRAADSQNILSGHATLATTFPGCSTTRPLQDDFPLLFSRISHPGYTDDGTYLWPNTNAFIRRNIGYTNDFQYRYPNGQIMVLRNMGYTNDKSLYWPNGKILMTRNYGYTNDGTLWRPDGSRWVLRNQGYTNDGTISGSRFAEYFQEENDGSLIYVYVSLNGDLSVNLEVVEVTNNYEINVFYRPSWGFDPINGDTLEIDECLGYGPYGARLPQSPAKIDVQPESESSVSVLITPKNFLGNNTYRYSIAENTAPADCSQGFPAIGNPFLIRGLKAGVNYGIRVCGAGAGNLLSSGVTANGRTLPPIPPAQPIVEGLTSSDPTVIDLSIRPGDGGSQTIAFVLSTKTTFCAEAENIGLVSRYSLYDLKPNQIHTITVCAVDRMGNYSAPRTLRLPSGIVQPRIQIAKVGGSPEIRWTWQWPDSEFHVERASDPSGPWIQASDQPIVSKIANEKLVWKDLDSSADQSRFYRVRFIK